MWVLNLLINYSYYTAGQSGVDASFVEDIAQQERGNGADGVQGAREVWGQQQENAEGGSETCLRW